jgi:hypothetical protein
MMVTAMQMQPAATTTASLNALAIPGTPEMELTV